jgi:FkbM family methyltransferase
MLRSLLLENRDEKFVIHFLHDGAIPADDRDRLASIVEGFGASWEPVGIGADLISGFPAMERYGGFAVWFRLLLPRLLGDVERVLYLDADLLILERIRALWEIDLGERCLAAATQPLLRGNRQRVVRDLGLPDAGRYFNTGVMVMDLARLRDTGLMLEAERVPREGAIPIPWADQDSLNVAMWAQRVDLHPRWNVMNPCFELPLRHLPWSREQVAEAVAHPAIIHFIGPYKPWHYRLRHPYAARYFAHLEQTPWRGRSRQGRSTRHVILRPLPPLVALRYEMAEYALKRAAVAAKRGTFNRLRRGLSHSRRLYALARAAHRLLSPASAPEALTDILDAFADATPDACFIQIGSNDADFGDPLRPYVESRGWRGIMVEPVPYVFERLRSRYADNGRITLVNAAIAAEDRQLPFYYVAESDDVNLPEWYDKLGSFDLENVLHPYHLEHIPDLADRVVCEEVRCSTFEALWSAHTLPRLDLVHVDAEGYDDEILKQIDLDRLRPTLLLYEHKHLSEDRREAIEAQLAGGGYELLDLGPDALAVRADAPLLVRLAVRRHRGR